jgi:uncharacterized protein
MRKISIILFFLSLVQIAWSQSSEKGIENALLWKIEGKGLPTPSYLFGTIHMIPAQDYFLPQGMEKVLTQVTSMYFEIDMDEMNDMSVLLGLMDKILMQNDTSLSDLLNTEEYTRIEHYFDSKGLPLAMFDRIKPLFASALVGVDGDAFGLNDGRYKSYELELAAIANSKNIKIEGLESMDFQLSIFDSIPYAVQAEMLYNAVNASGENQKQMTQMVEYYKQQNLQHLNKTLTAEDHEFLPYMEMMLYNRNMNWIPIMKTKMKEGACLFAVGAGHLGGQRGVIQLLRNEGYKVLPIIKK